MQLQELLRSIYTEKECQHFLQDALSEHGRDAWDSTNGPWKTRAGDLANYLTRHGLANRSFFEALLTEVPGRADDIAAVCRHVLNEPLNYTAGNPPAEANFPWANYQRAMSPGLVQLLQFAVYDSRSRGFTTISTSEIVRVYGALQPWVRAILPIRAEDLAVLKKQESPFAQALGASYCVSKTIHGLAQTTHQPNKYTEHDVFLDLLRFGNGQSVRKLIPDGAALDAINEWSRRLGIGRLTRHARLDEVDATIASP